MGSFLKLLSRLFQMQDEEVVISQSAPRDSGYYQCRAENEAGMAQGTIHLRATASSKALKSCNINIFNGEMPS